MLEFIIRPTWLFVKENSYPRPSLSPADYPPLEYYLDPYSGSSQYVQDSIREYVERALFETRPESITDFVYLNTKIGFKLRVWCRLHQRFWGKYVDTSLARRTFAGRMVRQTIIPGFMASGNPENPGFGQLTDPASGPRFGWVIAQAIGRDNSFEDPLIVPILLSDYLVFNPVKMELYALGFPDGLFAGASMNHEIIVHKVDGFDPLGYFIYELECTVNSQNNVFMKGHVYDESRDCILTFEQQGFVQSKDEVLSLKM
ncbi:hypothetical protein Ddc_22765 [Ditylenchus destructor]|nr:hypothetical protein Ddc_22765 [Ditylenchus destructor]